MYKNIIDYFEKGFEMNGYAENMVTEFPIRRT